MKPSYRIVKLPVRLLLACLSLYGRAPRLLGPIIAYPTARLTKTLLGEWLVISHTADLCKGLGLGVSRKETPPEWMNTIPSRSIIRIEGIAKWLATLPIVRFAEIMRKVKPDVVRCNISRL